MPNTSAAKKDLRQSSKRAERNTRIKEGMLYAAKMVRKAVESGNVEEARKQVLVAQQIFAKAAQKDIIKKNTASRRTSRLAKRVHALGSQK
ncbi:30S ribosomal protein S20 [Candidatus Uhrbacteria bacterium RIFCSPLOWO2_01_FULL_53_9]|uniref:Small ribosomal subunit protein bS20 n=2 Tax=Candidatus Uhriibacteriota TaxID=1752732 RepID=A0A1F7UY17_9BACT|nr:MAG: 30S ribosomal protein S20 [Candidatus Uhrbacteria bacterium RIFCSPLOWO2_01_FULL_53_9]OGL89837.1 MAG: 30S ribosomal protein S20 [Candidatus Uhrbacteria bacterium RIFCSPLOWO2_02_FULL_53_10]